MDTRRAPGSGEGHAFAAASGDEAGPVEIVDLRTVRGGGRHSSNTILFVVALVATGVLFGVVIASPRLDVASASPSPTSGISLASPSDAVTPPPTPRPSRPGSTPNPTSPPPTPYPWEWRSVVVDAFVSGVRIERMWSLGDRYVALVSDTEQENRPNGLMVSPDGVNWARGLMPEPGFQIRAAAASSGTLWVIGSVESEDPPTYKQWSTHDVSTWSSDFDPQGLLPGQIDILAMAPRAYGWVMVVRQATTDEAGEARTVIMKSDDGVTWSAAETFESSSGWVFTGLATTGRRALVLMTRSLEDKSVEVVAVRTFDGAGWTIFPVATIQGSVRVVDARSGDFLVGGAEIVDGTLQPRIWRSPNGRDWTAKTIGMAAGHPQVPIDGIVSGAFGYLAFSHSGETWWSYDGVAWRNRAVWSRSGVGTIDGLTILGENILAWGRGGEADTTIYLGDRSRLLSSF